MRIAKDGAHFRHKYDKVHISPMPYNDLALRSQELCREWEEARV
jgi:tRNA(adenine34) deaminase